MQIEKGDELMAKVRIVENHIDDALNELENKKQRILEMLGLKAEKYVKALTPVGTPESTGIPGYIGGTLRNSITHQVRLQDSEVDIGTNVEYAPYVEFNEKANHPTGKAHFLRDGIQNNMGEFKKIIETEMKK